MTKPRFSKSDLDDRAETMRSIGYPQHQIDHQLGLMRRGFYTALDMLPMIEREMPVDRNPSTCVGIVTGAELTPRMVSMRITGMWAHGAGWLAIFEQYPRVSFAIPQPIVDWLMEAE